MPRKTPACIPALVRAGISEPDALALRRIAMTLHRWHELECGTGSGCIERNETTGQPYYYDANSRFLDPYDPRNRWPIPDREKGALQRLASIMARYPTLGYYVQGDPRGAALWILRPGDVPPGQHPESCYTQGLPVYK